MSSEASIESSEANVEIIEEEAMTAKGQLISKCPFGVFKSSKKNQQIFFQDFCPSLYKEDKSKK